MTTQSFARPLLMLVALLSVQLFAVAPSQADREKTFSRSGRLIVVDKPAAELMPSYDIKNQPPAQAFPVPRPPWSSDLIFPCSQCHARMQPPNPSTGSLPSTTPRSSCTTGKARAGVRTVTT